jgi:hypothetical protein
MKSMMGNSRFFIAANLKKWIRNNLAACLLSKHKNPSSKEASLKKNEKK